MSSFDAAMIHLQAAMSPGRRQTAKEARAALDAARAQPRFLALPPPTTAVVDRVELLERGKPAQKHTTVVVHFRDAHPRYHCLPENAEGTALEWMREALDADVVVRLQAPPTTHDLGIECLTHIDDLRIGTHWRYDSRAINGEHARSKAPTGDATVPDWPVIPFFMCPDIAEFFLQHDHQIP